MQSTAETTVRRLADSECAAWNQYLAQRGPGYLFHRAEWDRVFAAYDLLTIRIAAFRQGQIVGVLPLVCQRSVLFGKHLVSLPWFDAAGLLVDDDLAQRALLGEAARLADSYRVQTVQLRQLEKGVGNLLCEAPSGPFRQKVPDPFFQSERLRTDKVLMRLALSHDPGSIWRGLLPKVRNQIRKAEKSGLVVSCGGAELLGEFYRIYSENMRDLGSPPHHRRFFQAVLANFEGESNIYVVRLDNETVGAALTMANGGILETPWASSLERYNPYCVNHLMYWRILESACRQSYAWFHFGRSSRGSGTYQFKKQWESKDIQSGREESKETQLYWYYLTRGKGKEKGVGNPLPARPGGARPGKWVLSLFPDRTRKLRLGCSHLATPPPMALQRTRTSNYRQAPLKKVTGVETLGASAGALCDALPRFFWRPGQGSQRRCRLLSKSPLPPRTGLRTTRRCVRVLQIIRDPLAAFSSVSSENIAGCT